MTSTCLPQRLQELRDLLYRRLNDHLPGRVRLTGHPARRLPGTLHISIVGVRGDDVLAATPAIAAATGSACHARSQEPSPVLLAMPHDRGQALSALRLSLGRWTTRPDVEHAAEAIATSAARTSRGPASPDAPIRHCRRHGHRTSVSTLPGNGRTPSSGAAGQRSGDCSIPGCRQGYTL